MTRNQIEYWNTQENKRHNIVTEQETGRHNVVTEGETHRHNIAQEGIDMSKLAETTRHNKVTEGETSRHNLVTEAQTNRSLDQGDVNLAISAARQAEDARHNKASESIGYGNISLGYSQLGELARHNKVSEAQTDLNLGLAERNLNETIRHNVRGEDISASRTRAQNALDNARTELTEIQNNWADYEHELGTKLSETQIDSFKQNIDESLKRMDKMDSDITHNKYSNFESLTKSLYNIANTIQSGIETGKDINNIIQQLKVLKALGG